MKHTFTLLVSLRQCKMALISNLDLKFCPQLGYLICFTYTLQENERQVFPSLSTYCYTLFSILSYSHSIFE